jgi:hypothetical protein
MFYKPEHTLEEVADELQKCGLSKERLTRERVRQIEQDALRKLHMQFIRRGIFTLGELLWAKEGRSEECSCEGVPDGLLV